MSCSPCNDTDCNTCVETLQGTANNCKQTFKIKKKSKIKKNLKLKKSKKS